MTNEQLNKPTKASRVTSLSGTTSEIDLVSEEQQV